MSNEKWVVTYNEEGKAIRWAPIEQHLAGRHINDIWQRTHIAPFLWGRPIITDKDTVYQIAKEEYEKYKEELPISYLEYYNPNRNDE